MSLLKGFLYFGVLDFPKGSGIYPFQILGVLTARIDWNTFRETTVTIFAILGDMVKEHLTCIFTQ